VLVSGCGSCCEDLRLKCCPASCTPISVVVGIVIHAPLVLTCLIALCVDDGDGCSGALDAFLVLTMLLSLVHLGYVIYYFNVFRFTDAGPPVLERASELALYHIPSAIYIVVHLFSLVWATLGFVWASDCDGGGKASAAMFAVMMLFINGFILPTCFGLSVYLENGRQQGSASCLVGWCLPSKQQQAAEAGTSGERVQVSKQATGSVQKREKASKATAPSSDSSAAEGSWKPSCCRPSRDQAEQAPPHHKKGGGRLRREKNREECHESDTMPRGVVTALPEEEEPRMVLTEKDGIVAYHMNPTHVGIAPNQ